MTTSKEKFSCLIVGSGTLPIRCGELIVREGHRLTAVVSTDEKVRRWARSQNVTVYRTRNEFVAGSNEPIDYLFSIVNNEILRDDVLRLPRKLAINYHDAPLPRYAGTHATSWALLNHERTHGVSWHVITELVDAGDLLKQEFFEIDDDETAHSLNTKCYEAATRAFADLLVDLSSGTCIPSKQNLDERTWFPRFQRPADGGVISWTKPARDISALIRALDFGPHPNPLGVAKIAIDDTFVIVSGVASSGQAAESSPGTVNEIGSDFLRVSTSDQEILLRQFRHLDGRALSISDFTTEFAIQTGYRFADLEKSVLDQIETSIKATCKSESYWVKKLLSLDPAVPPFAEANSVDVSRELESHTFIVPNEFLQLEGKTTANIIAAFGGFISRLIDNDSFDIGFRDETVDGPPRAVEPLLTECVPLRINVDLTQNFSDVSNTIEAELEAVRRHVAFNRDVAARYPELSRAVETGNFSSLPIDVVVSSGRGMRSQLAADISLIVNDDGGKCRIVFDKKKFSAENQRRFIEYFTTFLTGIARKTNVSLGYLPILSDEERELLLDGLNSDRIDVPSGKCIHHLFEDQVERTPTATALVVGDVRVTYQELNTRSERVARRLRALGVGPDVLVAICVERSVDLVVGILGILKSGGAYVPLDPAYPKARLDQILADSKAAVVVTHSNVLGKLGEHDAEVVLLDSVGNIENITDDRRPSEVRPDNLAYVIYTSGSTGRPKGVAIEHRSTVALLAWATSSFGIERLKRTVASTSVCFDLSVFEIFAPLSCGGAVILVENILQLPAAPAAAEATLLNTVPSAITELLRMNGIPESVATVNLAGEPLKTSLVKQLYATKNVAEVFDLYGPTEDTTYSTYTLRTEGKATIGRPLPNTQAYILDRNLQPVPPGIPGELYLAGDGLARGYLNQEELTASRFVENPFKLDVSDRMYRTGDLVRYLPSFEIEYLGRIDNQVKVRGFRIELGEIETVLTRHAAVEEAVVVAREDKPGEKRLVAYIVVDRKENYETSDLREHLKKALPDFMIPAAFVELDEMPLTPNGKIDRKALPAPSHSLTEANRNYVAPRSEIETRLVNIWERLLDLSPIGIRDDFFELGGDSLVSVSLFVEIESEFGIALPLSVLISSSTIEKLAAALADNRSMESRKYVVPLQTDGTQPPLFCMHAAGGNVLFYRDLANELGNDRPFYGLQARGVADKSETAHDRVEDMARDYLQEIRSVQPDGPYHLCGASFGGLVAFEAARQLIAMGETVGLLALFDTYAPGYIAESPDVSQHSRLKTLVFRTKSIKNQLRELDTWGRRLEFIRSKAMKVNKRVKRKIAWTRNQFAIEYNKATGRELPPNMMRNHAAIKKAMDTYMPDGKLAANMVLFRASEQPTAQFDQYLGWTTFVDGEVVPIEVKGAHGALTVYPYATDLAAKLKPVLDGPELAKATLEKEKTRSRAA